MTTLTAYRAGVDQPNAAPSAAHLQGTSPLRADIARLLASPPKLAILSALDTIGPMTVDTIHETCSDGRTRGALYPHLQALKTEGWIEVAEYRRVRGTAEETLALTAAGREAHWARVVDYLNALPSPTAPAE